MKIKLAILENDKSYLSRLVSAFGIRYADKFQIFSFTDQSIALNTVESQRIDVLLASDAFDITPEMLPNRCAFAYLVDSAGIEKVNNQCAICKFQKVNLLYKQILGVYVDKASRIIDIRLSGDEGRVIAFCSASGGVGSSTMAAACASHFAAKGKKVLYLNLEKFGGADIFFSAPGQGSMSDVIFAVKSKKAQLFMKLESCVKQDRSGVQFFSPTKIALDMMEMTSEDMVGLITELRFNAGFNYIILDMDFGLEEDLLRVYREAQQIVLISDGSPVSNMKTERAYAALEAIEHNADMPLYDRMVIAYNKVSSKYGQSINLPGVKVLGGAPRYSDADMQQLVTQLSQLPLFDAML